MLHVLLWCNEHLARGQSAQCRQRLLPRQLRHVVFLTQVRQHERSRAAFHQIRCKYGAVRIGQVPARSGNTHLERIRVRTGLQHVRVMVALQHDHFTAAQKLGRIIRTATDADNPEQFFLGESGAFRFFKGKITDVLRETRDGFNFGRVTLEGIGEDKGKKAVVEFQNENIYAEVDGEIVATVPDLICLVDSETFVPITTENLKYGKRALVVGLPCDAAWRTPRGLKDVEYRPVEERYAEFSKEESHA